MRSEDEHRSEFSDFTEAEYRKLLRLAKSRGYLFTGYGDVVQGRHLLWRHDLDASMNRALRLAEIEHEEGVKATYFVFPRCLFYNILNELTKDVARRIVDLGHDIALHFDPTQYRSALSKEALTEAISNERDLLQRELGVRPTAVSFHLYGVLEGRKPEEDQIAGLTNAYSKRLQENYSYVSDSNGIWLYRRLFDVLSEAKEDRLQVLTHPEWWTPDVMSPRARLQRAIDGYAAAMGRWYDEIVAKSGRPNLR